MFGSTVSNVSNTVTHFNLSNLNISFGSAQEAADHETGYPGSQPVASPQAAAPPEEATTQASAE